MISQEGDVRAVHGAAHVQTAGHRNSDLGRKGHLSKIIKKFIHDRFDHGRGIRCRCMAMDIALGVHNVGQACTRPANGELIAS